MLYNYIYPELVILTSLPTRLTSRGTAGERLGHCLLVFREESDNLLRRQTLSSLFYVSKKQFKGTGCSFTPFFKGSTSLFLLRLDCLPLPFVSLSFFLWQIFLPRCRMTPVLRPRCPWPWLTYSRSLEHQCSSFFGVCLSFRVLHPAFTLIGGWP